MSIINGFIPLPNWYITRGFTLKLTHRERVLYFTIGVEIFRFPESRETMSKEMTTRGLQAITGINHSHIARILNKFQRMGIIAVQKSFIKGLSSIVTVISLDKLGAEIATDNKKLVAETATEVKKSGAKKATYPKNLNSKKDLKKDDSNSLLNIEQAIEEKPMKNSLDSLPDTKSFLTSSEDSNSNNTAINLLCPRPGASAPSKVKFSSLASVLPAVISAPSPQQNLTAPIGAPVTAPPTAGIKPAIIEKGKAILQEKGFTAPQIQAITQRITDSIRKHLPKKPDSYFLTAVKNEKIKTSVTIPPALGNNTTGSPDPQARQIPPAPIGAMVQVQKRNSFTETVNRWEEEKKKDSPENILKKLMELSPDDLYRVILDVDNSPASKFISLPEIKASLYIAEFKKRYPDMKI